MADNLTPDAGTEDENQDSNDAPLDEVIVRSYHSHDTGNDEVDTPDADATRPYELVVTTQLDELGELIRPQQDDTPPPDEDKRKSCGCRVAVWALIILTVAVVCVLSGGGWLVWGYFNDELPPQIADLLTQVPQNLPLPTPMITSPPPETTGQPSPEGAATPTDADTEGSLLEPTTGAGTPDTIDSPTPEVTGTGEEAPPPDGPMVYVPGGTFTMGSNMTDSESPIHEVTLDPYYIDRYEVTNAQWIDCVNAGVCLPPASTYAYVETPYYGEEDFDDYPVIFVSWHDADTFCQWRDARLPTEAERFANAILGWLWNVL